MDDENAEEIKKARELIEECQKMLGELENRLDQPQNALHDFELLSSVLTGYNRDLKWCCELLRIRNEQPIRR